MKLIKRLAMRLSKNGKYTQRELADKYNMEQTNIFYIANNKTWKK